MHPLSVRVAEDHGRQKAQFIEQFANSHVHMCCNRGKRRYEDTLPPWLRGTYGNQTEDPQHCRNKMFLKNNYY